MLNMELSYDPANYSELYTQEKWKHVKKKTNLYMNIQSYYSS